jgi:tripartite-type tricarboxylate transporter receptor subunit TctC
MALLNGRVVTRMTALGMSALLLACSGGGQPSPQPTTTAPATQAPSPTAEDVAAFYAGKTVKLVVGTSPGGGFDTYIRLIGRHLAEHTPGNPTVIVENRPGAGSLVAANGVYNVDPQDGTVIVMFIGGVILQDQIGAEGAEFDPELFQYLGAPASDEPVCVVDADLGISSLGEASDLAEPVRFGGVGPGSQTDDVPNILRSALGLNIEVVSGYEGTSGVRLAVESGEVDGACFNWSSIQSTWGDLVDSGTVVPIAAGTLTPIAGLEEVPLMVDLATDDFERRVVEIGISRPSQFNRPVAVGPGVPAARVAALTDALAAALADPDLLAEADELGLPINPLTSEQLREAIATVTGADQDVIDALTEALRPE